MISQIEEIRIILTLHLTEFIFHSHWFIIIKNCIKGILYAFADKRSIWVFLEALFHSVIWTNLPSPRRLVCKKPFAFFFSSNHS